MVVAMVEASREGAGLAGAPGPVVGCAFSASEPAPAGAAAAAVDCVRRTVRPGGRIDGEEEHTDVDQAGSCCNSTRGHQSASCSWRWMDGWRQGTGL